MLTIFYGTTGTGKSYAMCDKIKEDAAAGRKVCVVVPDQFTFEYERMLYNHLGCSLFNRGNTEVLSFSRLAADIFAVCRHPAGKAADSTVKTAVMYRVIRETAEKDGFLFFANQAKRPSFTSTAQTMVNELVHSGVTPEVLGELIKCAPDNMRDKFTDIFLIYSRFTAEIQRLGMRDPLTDPRTAAEYAVQYGYFRDMHLFMDEFKSFTGDQYGMIKAMLRDCSGLTVCLTADSLSGNEYGSFSACADTAAKLFSIARELGVQRGKREFTENKRYASEELFSLSKNITKIRPESFFANESSVTVAAAPDIYGECDYICAEIRRLLKENKNLRCSDIAVLSRAMNSDISVLAPVFERYGIPFYSDKKASAAHKPLMLMISSALELASLERISSETLFRYAKSGLTGLAPEEISSLENYCYKWDIDGRLWQSPFPDEEYENLRDRLLSPVFALKNSCTDKTGAEICEALRHFVELSGAEEKLLSPGEGHMTEAETAAEIRENERLLNELDSVLSSLEAALPEKIPVKGFREIFSLCAAEITLAKPPEALDGVCAQQSDLARLMRPKIVFVMHANDGVFPFVTGESLTFSERERDFFRSKDHDLSGSMKKRMAEERFNAVKALCSPSEKLYITYSAASPDGSPLYPSPLIGKITACAENAVKLSTGKLGMLFYCRTEQSAYAAAIEGFDPSDPSFACVKSELSKNPLYRKKFDYIGRVDIGVGHRIKNPALMRRIYGNIMQVSASRFEDKSKCPFMFFCKTGLHIYPRSKMDLNPIVRGNIMHFCLKGIYSEKSKDNFIAMTKEELKESISEHSRKYIEEELGGSFAKNGSFAFYMEMTEEVLLTVLMQMQEEMKVSDFVPADFEISVGAKGQGGFAVPAVIECGEGLAVNFTGTADRADVYTDENGISYLRILDYKTGSKDFFKEQLLLGINMQMFFYIFALTRKNGGKFAGFVPAGVLYYPVKYPKHCDKRHACAEDSAKCIDDGFKMQGMLLEDMKVIEAMDKTFSGRFIPVKLKDGTPSKSSCTADTELMDKLREYAVRCLEDMGRAVYGGDIPADPLESKKYKCPLPCPYCNYRNICGNYPNGKKRDLSDVDFLSFFTGKTGSEDI